MTSASEYATRMISALALSEPELDTSIGSPTRKILDVVAEIAAEAGVDSHLLNYQFDITTKTGADLDDYCLMFGITRFAAQRAVGVVTLFRPLAALADILIPMNTQVVTGTSPQVAFTTAAPAFLLKGTTSVTVPVVALLGGNSGNLPANSLTTVSTPIDGIGTACNNYASVTGGTNTEPDDVLISRFKKTVFRSMAGTESMLLGVTLEGSAATDPTSTQNPTQAIVLGSSKRWREQVQIASDGTAISTIPASNVKYVYPGSSYLGTDIDSGVILTPGVDYTFGDMMIPPVVTGLYGSLTVGALYDLDFEYSPSSSRNDPLNGITNRIDIWCNGQMPTEASQSLYFRATILFSAVGTDKYGAAKFVRQDTIGTHPSAGNYFLQLAYGPVMTFPATLTIGGIVYTKGVDYWVVHDDTAFGYGPTSMFGLEWIVSHTPAVDAAISLFGSNTYMYNRVPRDVEDRARRWRLVTTDLRAHAAKRVSLVLNLAVMFSLSYDRTQVQADISSAVTAFLEAKGFDEQVQVSDLLQTIHNVPGVDNIRFLTSTEPINLIHYGIEQVSDAGSFIGYITSGNPGRAADLALGDNQIPVLYGINYSIRASNTFGVS